MIIFAKLVNKINTFLGFIVISYLMNHDKNLESNASLYLIISILCFFCEIFINKAENDINRLK